MAFRSLFWALKWGIITAITVWMIQYWITSKSYIFSPDDVAAIAKKHGGPNYEESYRTIHREFELQYPGHILPEQDLQWIFVNAGGWMGAMCLLHASLTEYVLFFGTPIDTSGHSGRYWANVSDTILTGAMKQWPEGTIKHNSYQPGDTILHAWGETTMVEFGAGTWMVEYGRGFIPSTLGFALADTIFSTQDFLTMYYTFRIYILCMYRELSHQVGDYIS